MVVLAPKFSSEQLQGLFESATGMKFPKLESVTYAVVHESTPHLIDKTATYNIDRAKSVPNIHVKEVINVSEFVGPDRKPLWKIW